MKAAFILFLIILLDWAALYDIIKGDPDPYAEYSMLLLSVVVFCYIVVKKAGRRRENT